jgi:O-glycosyl hydrolase
MKLRFLYWLCVLLLLTGMQAVHSQETAVRINPFESRQTIEGWGVSLCWWANMCGKWEESKIDELVDWMTSPDKLNWNLFRYNIGGGDDPAHADGHMVTGKGKRAEMEGFLSSENSEYDWNADAAQRKILLKIREKRSDAAFEAFSNSPPYWMTYSGCSAGAVNAGSDNLKPAYYDAFCDYLIEVCKHYKEVYGLEFKTLEPFNEATTSYWGANGEQEGCHFNASSQVALLRKLYPKLQASGLNTVLAVSDETSVGASRDVLRTYKNAGDILPMLGQWNTHTYNGNSKQRGDLRNLVLETGLPFWMSESGAGGNGLGGNLAMAQRMFDDLNIMHPQAWIDWQFVEEGNDQWCMVRGNFANQTRQIVKNFYVRMQVTRFIKQGYTLLDSPDSRLLLALNPEKTALVIVALNSSDAAIRFKTDLSLFETAGSSAVCYKTDASLNCNQTTNIAVSAEKAMNITLASKTILTCIVPITVGEPVSRIDPAQSYLLMPRIASTVARAQINNGTGTGVSLSDCDITDALQQWRLLPVNEEEYCLYTKLDGNYYAMTDNNVYALALNPLNKLDAKQRFHIRDAEDGNLSIISYASNKSLDLDNENTAAGTQIGLWDYGIDRLNSHRQWRLLSVPFSTPDIGLGIKEIDAENAESLIQATFITGRNTLKIHSVSPAANLEIFNTQATKLVHAQGSSSYSYTLPSGVYFVRIASGAKSRNYKVLINE